MSTMARQDFAGCLEYAVVDVFAQRPLEGNALAIFSDGRGLSTEQMQALARETNLSETTFLLPEDAAMEEAHGVRVRIFTTAEELPFAGPPTLGTASWLYWHHGALRGRRKITLRLNSGPVEVEFLGEVPQEDAGGVFATMSQQDPVFGAVYGRTEIAKVLGVPEDALDPGLPVQVVSTGVPFCLAPFVSVEALSRLAIPQAAAQRWLDRAGAKFFYCVAPLAETGAAGPQFEARMQFYSGEDPATGSAAGCAIAWLVRHGVVESGRQVVLTQGARVGRPSLLYVEAKVQADGSNGGETGLVQPKIHQVRVGGRTIPVASGRFFRPGSGGFPQAVVIKQQQLQADAKDGG
jgi:trans-2,3-dihydro-3-hydroxyanthranilate isomerase